MPGAEARGGTSAIPGFKLSAESAAPTSLFVATAPDPSTAPGADGGPPDPQVVSASEDAADAAAAGVITASPSSD